MQIKVIEYDRPNKNRHVYCCLGNDSLVTLLNGMKFEQGWELTTLDETDRAYFDASPDEFYSLQTNLPKPVLEKIDRWKNGDEAIDDVATLFKNKSYALRWFRLR